MALRPLTVDFHEPPFAKGLGEETRVTLAKGFWFQLDEQGQQQAKVGWGPANPQALNRYAYVLNNPVRYTDPEGHGGCNWLCIGMFKAIGQWWMDRYSEWQAWEAFRNGETIIAVGELGSFMIDPNRVFGRNLRNIHQISTGRLRGYGEGTSDLPGGEAEAKTLFRRLTGRDPDPDLPLDRVVLGEREIVYRPASRSGVPKVDIVDHIARFRESITFR